MEIHEYSISMEIQEYSLILIHDHFLLFIMTIMTIMIIMEIALVRREARKRTLGGRLTRFGRRTRVDKVRRQSYYAANSQESSVSPTPRHAQSPSLPNPLPLPLPHPHPHPHPYPTILILTQFHNSQLTTYNSSLLPLLLFPPNSHFRRFTPHRRQRCHHHHRVSFGCMFVSGLTRAKFRREATLNQAVQ